MSNKPKIYGTCAAGCLWETVHKDDFLRSASIVKQFDSGAGYALEAGRNYKVKKSNSGASVWGFTLTIVYSYVDSGNGKQQDRMADVDLPAASQFDDYLNIKICGWYKNGTDKLVYELNGEKIEIDVGTLPYVQYSGVSVSGRIVNSPEVFLYNEDATVKAEDGNGIASIEKTATNGLVDTYTITFDNGSTTTFTVTNGEKGEQGEKGSVDNIVQSMGDGEDVAMSQKAVTEALNEQFEESLNHNFYIHVPLSFEQGSFSSDSNGHLSPVEKSNRIRTNVIQADSKSYVLRTSKDDLEVLLSYAWYDGDGYRYFGDSPNWYRSGDSIPIKEGATHFVMICRHPNNSNLTAQDGDDIKLLFYGIDDELSATSERPLQNKVVAQLLESMTPEQTAEDILTRNKDIEHIVNAGANYGWHQGGQANPNKRFTMLVTTDVHQSYDRMNEAIKYLNSMGAIDCGICVGDMAAGYYNDTDGTWYRDIIANSTKPFLTVIGNHDMGNTKAVGQSATVAQATEKWILPNVSKIGDATIDKSYYFVDYPAYNIRVFVLNSYDTPDTLENDTTFLVDRKIECYSQAQIDWFVNALQNTPAGYHVLICSHYSASKATQDTSIKFNHSTRDFPSRDPQSGVIADVVNAFVNGTSVSGTYNGISGGVPSVTVNTDFSTRGAGVLIGYLSGHLHWDCVGHIAKYPTQKAFAFNATADGNWQNGEDDIPRQAGTKAIDSITTLSVDTAARKIYITRVGADVSNAFQKREPTAIAY